MTALRLGISVSPQAYGSELLSRLADRVLVSGAMAVAAVAHAGAEIAAPWSGSARIGHGAVPTAPLSIMEGSGSGAQQHTGLAAAGCQVILSIRGKSEGPLGSPICPVISVSLHGPTFEALADDFDIDASSSPADTAADHVWDLALKAFSGGSTASERRGARDFALRRIARST
jgi:hypothetical protein